MIEARLYCAIVSVLPLSVTPPPAATVTTPAPRFVMLTTVPVGNATEAFDGIVTVTLEAFEQVTFFPASVRTSVYVVPVWALIPLPA
jgi:hypothetical protein